MVGGVSSNGANVTKVEIMNSQATAYVDGDPIYPVIGHCLLEDPLGGVILLGGKNLFTSGEMNFNCVTFDLHVKFLK